MPTAPSAEEQGYLAGAVVAGEVPALNPDANAAAPSSTADDKKTPDANEPTSILEAVQKAASAPKPAAASSATEGEDGKTIADDPEAAAKAAAAKAADDKEVDPPFHTHPRWQEMKRERDTFKEGHERFLQLHTFMQNANLEPAEVNSGFQIMAAMKNDPQAAYDALLPYMQNLETILGKKLPPDLQEQVDDGHATEEIATELAQRRSRQAAAEAAGEKAKTEAQAAQAAQVSGAVSKWEADWQTADPDYAVKQPRVLEKIKLAILEKGLPASTAAAVKLANDSKAAVDAELAALRPKPKAIVPPVGGAAPKSVAEPKSLMDIIRQKAGPAAA